MIEHDYFGKITVNEWSEFYAATTINIPHFKERVKVRLLEYDEDFEPIEEVPSMQILNEYAVTVKNFTADIENVLAAIQQATFNYYLKIYAKYYEKPFEVIFENKKIQKSENKALHQPLQIDTKEKHFDYMNVILEKISISNNQTIVIPFCYAIDEEHGLEVKIRNNKVFKVGGIGETTYE